MKQKNQIKEKITDRISETSIDSKTNQGIHC